MKMTALLLALGVFFTMGAFVVEASSQQAAGEQAVVKAGSKPENKASNKTFTGDVSHISILPATPDANFAMSTVIFQPEARSFWHTHPAGQRLIVIEGSGLTGTADGKVEVINKGDVVECPAGVKHWHGASPTSAMTHIAITPFKDGKKVEWMEEVTDEQYSKR